MFLIFLRADVKVYLKSHQTFSRQQQPQCSPRVFWVIVLRHCLLFMQPNPSNVEKPWGIQERNQGEKKKLLADPTVFRTLTVIFTWYLPLENFENRLSGASLPVCGEAWSERVQC